VPAVAVVRPPSSRLAKASGHPPNNNARLGDDLAELFEQRAGREGVHKSDDRPQSVAAHLV
jgi:hypothetical protein